MLHVLVGSSGSGKSTFCQSYFSGLNIIILSSDTLRGIIGKDESDQSVNSKVFEILKASTALILKQGLSVVIDATSYSRKSRKDFIDLARKYNHNITAYYFDVPADICKKRNSMRDRKVPDFVIDKQIANMEIPTKEEIDALHTVNSDGKTYQNF